MSYGCRNREPFAENRICPDLWVMDDGLTEVPKKTVVPFRMEKTCQYSSSELGEFDCGCDGCVWRKA